jgi:hypothetical protein
VQLLQRIAQRSNIKNKHKTRMADKGDRRIFSLLEEASLFLPLNKKSRRFRRDFWQENLPSINITW